MLRADSGFWNTKVTARLREQDSRYSIGVKLNTTVLAPIALICDDAWEPVADYPNTGICELAETTLGEDRPIVRRVHPLAQEDQAELVHLLASPRVHHQPHRADGSCRC